MPFNSFKLAGVIQGTSNLLKGSANILSATSQAVDAFQQVDNNKIVSASNQFGTELNGVARNYDLSPGWTNDFESWTDYDTAVRNDQVPMQRFNKDTGEMESVYFSDLKDPLLENIKSGKTRAKAEEAFQQMEDDFFGSLRTSFQADKTTQAVAGAGDAAQSIVNRSTSLLQTNPEKAFEVFSTELNVFQENSPFIPTETMAKITAAAQEQMATAFGEVMSAWGEDTINQVKAGTLVHPDGTAVTKDEVLAEYETRVRQGQFYDINLVDKYSGETEKINVQPIANDYDIEQRKQALSELFDNADMLRQARDYYYQEPTVDTEFTTGPVQPDYLEKGITRVDKWAKNYSEDDYNSIMAYVSGIDSQEKAIAQNQDNNSLTQLNLDINAGMQAGVSIDDMNKMFDQASKSANLKSTMWDIEKKRDSTIEVMKGIEKAQNKAFQDTFYDNSLALWETVIPQMENAALFGSEFTGMKDLLKTLSAGDIDAETALIQIFDEGNITEANIEKVMTALYANAGQGLTVLDGSGHTTTYSRTTSRLFESLRTSLVDATYDRALTQVNNSSLEFDYMGYAQSVTSGEANAKVDGLIANIERTYESEVKKVITEEDKARLEEEKNTLINKVAKAYYVEPGEEENKPWLLSQRWADGAVIQMTDMISNSRKWYATPKEFLDAINTVRNPVDTDLQTRIEGAGGLEEIGKYQDSQQKLATKYGSAMTEYDSWVAEIQRQAEEDEKKNVKSINDDLQIEAQRLVDDKLFEAYWGGVSQEQWDVMRMNALSDLNRMEIETEQPLFTKAIDYLNKKYKPTLEYNARFDSYFMPALKSRKDDIEDILGAKRGEELFQIAFSACRDQAEQLSQGGKPLSKDDFTSVLDGALSLAEEEAKKEKEQFKVSNSKDYEENRAWLGILKSSLETGTMDPSTQDFYDKMTQINRHYEEIQAFDSIGYERPNQNALTDALVAKGGSFEVLDDHRTAYTLPSGEKYLFDVSGNKAEVKQSVGGTWSGRYLKPLTDFLDANGFGAKKTPFTRGAEAYEEKTVSPWMVYNNEVDPDSYLGTQLETAGKKEDPDWKNLILEAFGKAPITAGEEMIQNLNSATLWARDNLNKSTAEQNISAWALVRRNQLRAEGVSDSEIPDILVKEIKAAQ